MASPTHLSSRWTVAWLVIVSTVLFFGTAASASDRPPSDRGISLPAPPLIDGVTDVDLLSRSTQKGRATFIDLITRAANSHGIPAGIADAVVRIESGYSPAAIGHLGEVGLMQVRPSTAAMLGFRGTNDELARPETNLHYGVSYLAKAWRLAAGDLCRALMKYRAGHAEERMTSFSVEYCRRARAHLARTGAAELLAGRSHAPVLPVLRPSLPSSLQAVAVDVGKGALRGALARKGQTGLGPGKEHPYFASHRARIAETYARVSAMANRKMLLSIHRGG